MEKNNIEVKNGVVVESLPNATFKVELEDGSVVMGHLSGKMRLYRISILPGDTVKMEFTPYDKARGRIVYREK